VNVLVWHVHGSWMTAFVQGRHCYHVPVVPDRGPDGLGRARTWDWPATTVEVTPEQVADLDVDVVVLQRERDLVLLDRWGHGRFRDTPKIWVEHDTPLDLPDPRHPMADRDDVVVAHVTAFNQTMWHTGSTPTTVIEHGVPDPGLRYTGTDLSAVAVINEPVRRAWVAGTDLLQRVRAHVPVKLHGMVSEALGGTELVQADLHDAMARHRVYLHPFRWTSLGLTLIEAMHLGMPVVALAATEVPRVLHPPAAVVAHDVPELVAGVTQYLRDPELAIDHGRAARALALERFGLPRFLDDWDGLLAAVA
jgi:hypothetical protein